MRSVVRGMTERCPRCRLTTRWCVCAAHRAVRCPLAVDVVMHHREFFRPTSTGHLIKRVLPESRQHVWRRERGLPVDDVRVPGRELWLVHPQGDLAPPGVAPEGVQVVLLDGAWGETSAMLQEMMPWGRRVRLPMTGESRYWLRAQQDGGRFSTVEALLFLLGSFDLTAAREALRLQFELHVYASLRARGRKETAEEFLRESPVRTEFPELLAQLNVRRPMGGGGGGEAVESRENGTTSPQESGNLPQL